MQNDFEKDVRKKMEELKLSPSDAVWQKVEAGITVKRKRRRGLVWFWLAGLLLSGGAAWLYQRGSVLSRAHIQKEQTGRNIQIPKASAEDKVEPTRKTPNKTTGESKQTLLKTETVKQRADQAPVPSTLHPISVSTGKDKGQSASLIKPVSGNILSTLAEPSIAIGAARRRKANLSSGANANPYARQHSQTRLAAIKPNEKALVTTGDKVTTVAEIQALPNDSEPLVKKESDPPLKIAAVVVADSAQSKPDSVLKKKAAAVNKKWSTELTASIGASGNVSGLLLTRNTSADYGASLSAGGGTLVPTTPAPRSYVPAKTKSGFAFNAGLMFSKKVSASFEFAFGLRYAFYSTHTKIGNKKTADTTATYNGDKIALKEYYPNDGMNDYTARFHSVEAPVRLSWHPFAGAPIWVSASAAYGYLVSTNALSFSSASNLYYRNRNDYKRHQVPLSASLQWRFAFRGGRSLQAGPVVQYNPARLQNQTVAEPPHLFFAGFGASLRL